MQQCQQQVVRTLPTDGAGVGLHRWRTECSVKPRIYLSHWIERWRFVRSAPVRMAGGPGFNGVPAPDPPARTYGLGMREIGDFAGELSHTLPADAQDPRGLSGTDQLIRHKPHPINDCRPL